jgi:predicted TIM-barrel fold metal-dependent hydrolase
MIIDDHAYWDPGHMSLEELQEQMRRHGLSGVILSPPCTQVYEPDKSPLMYAVQRHLLRSNVLRPVGEMVSQSFYDEAGRLRLFWRLFTRNSKPLNKVLVPDNTTLLAAISPFSNLYAWYWLNPASMPEKNVLEREIHHPRVAGVKLHAYWHRFTANDARRTFALAQDVGLPIYMILGFRWVGTALQLLQEFPSVPVIFGYGGFPYFDKLWKQILPFKNAMVDFASFHIDARGISDAVKILGAGRCLYGSDCPYNFKDKTGHFEYSKTMERIKQLPVGADALEDLFSRNAQKVIFSGKNTQPAWILR